MQPLSRRHFLKNTAMASAYFALPAITRHTINPGIQLWSVREDMKKDPVGTLTALSKMGYREIESYGYDGAFWGYNAKDFANLLKKIGMSMPSAHYNFSTTNLTPEGKLNDATLKVIDAAAEVGQKYLVNAWLPESEWKQLPKLGEVFHLLSAHCKKNGLRFGYHNHAFEFQQRHTDGRLMYEWLLHELSPAEMCFEMDIYWVTFAGYNPLDWFAQYPGRFELAHLKDMANSKDRETIEVGDGVIHFKDILAQRKKAGFKRMFVELEHYKTTPMQGVERARTAVMGL